MPPPKILPQSKIFHMSIHNYQIFPITIHNKKISYISKIAIKKKFPHIHHIPNKIFHSQNFMPIKIIPYAQKFLHTYKFIHIRTHKKFFMFIK